MDTDITLFWTLQPAYTKTKENTLFYENEMEPIIGSVPILSGTRIADNPEILLDEQPANLI